MRPVICRPLRALAVPLLLALITACGGESLRLASPEEAQVRGVVLEVVA